jgi:hypothetical protein
MQLKYELKISLKRAKPTIWRCIQIPGQSTLADLSRVIAVVMGWDWRAEYLIFHQKQRYVGFNMRTDAVSEAFNIELSDRILIEDIKNAPKPRPGENFSDFLKAYTYQDARRVSIAEAIPAEKKTRFHFMMGPYLDWGCLLVVEDVQPNDLQYPVLIDWRQGIPPYQAIEELSPKVLKGLSDSAAFNPRQVEKGLKLFGK